MADNADIGDVKNLAKPQRRKKISKNGGLWDIWDIA